MGRTSEQQQQQGSAQELIEFVLPGARADQCPAWPPDVFALAATVMKRNGAYVQCVVTGVGSSPIPEPLFEVGWPQQAIAVGGEWRKSVNETLNAFAGAGKLSIGDALKKTDIPGAVREAWRTMCDRASISLETSARDRVLVRALIQLSSYADEASYGIGLGRLGGGKDSGMGKAGSRTIALWKEKAEKAEAERQRLDRIIVAVLKASREDLDVSRKELAGRLGWKPEQVAELEIGRRIVRAADLILIARALKIEPDALLRRIARW